MAKIRNSNPKQSGGGYERLVGDKDMTYNFKIDKALHKEFEAFCKVHGMSKVGAIEQAIRQYMDKTNKAFLLVRE